MSHTAADILLDTLLDWEVEVIFGLPGDGINGIMEALRKRQDKIRFVQVRHEETAAFMACGYAKYTGKLGVCLATSGPGGLHLLNGLYDAKLDGQPVLAITGMQFHDLTNTFTQQDVELDKVFIDVAKYNVRIMSPEHVANAASLACRTAIYYKGVSHITIAADIQNMKVEKKHQSERNIPNHNSKAKAHSAGLPSDEDLVSAVEILNQGKKIVILAGRGALDASDELLEIAKTLKAPIVKALLGKASVPDASEYTTGGIGLLGTVASQNALEDCDTLLMVGTSFPYIEYFPKPGKARAVQIEKDPIKIGLRYPVEVGLLGDSKNILRALLKKVKGNDDSNFLEKAQKETRKWWDLMEEQSTRKDIPMKPQVVAWELGKRLKDNAIVSSDSGTIATWFARQIPARKGQKFSLSGNLASMGNGLPYAMAAQIAYPDSQCIAFVGDGGFSMLMADFVTCVKYKLPVKIVIIKNNTLGQIKWEQMVFLGNVEYGCELEPIDFAAFARACGAVGYTIDDPASCGDILEEALAQPGPVIIEAVVDPFEAPMPPKVTLDQITKFTQSLIKGEPHREQIALTAISNKVREMI